MPLLKRIVPVGAGQAMPVPDARTIPNTDKKPQSVMSTNAKTLSGKIALITGSNSGIGLATARLFVAEGARVAITGRNQKTLDVAASELGDSILAIKADAADVASTE